METENHNLAGLLDLRDHANDLLERGARTDAMGALRAGVRAIMDLVTERPTWRRPRVRPWPGATRN